jgi:cyclopropane fatty-acyl-phospholipid synthase-like methyltransferase
MEKEEWYVDWFDSKFYHLLYNHRNYSEANFFIDQLCKKLKLHEGSKVWDMACGKGRHAIALSKKGYNVTGTDLSKNSISSANEHSNSHLHFLVHDMRSPFRENNFEAVLNLFTSFGYFTDPQDNINVFRNVSNCLVKNGSFVLDFFNSARIESTPEQEYDEKRNDITFRIKKTVGSDAVKKEISFKHDGHHFKFEERVALLRMPDFETFAEAAGLKIHHCFGNYQLEDFDERSSDRLIIIFKKIN